MVKNYKLPFISPVNVMYSMVTIIENIAYKRVDLKISYHKKIRKSISVDIIQRKHTGDQPVHEKVLDISNHPT